MDAVKITELPKARIVVLDGIKQSPSQPVKHGKLAVHTLWGDLAWQLGKEEGYERIRESDINGTQPGKTVLMELLAAYAPCVILMDELVAYLRQFEEGKSYTGSHWIYRRTDGAFSPGARGRKTPGVTLNWKWNWHSTTRAANNMIAFAHRCKAPRTASHG